MSVHSWTMEQYLAFDAFSAGKLHTIVNGSPLHYRHEIREPSQAMRFGTLEHTAVLEPHALSSRFAVWRTKYLGGEKVNGVTKSAGDNRPCGNSKAAKAFKAEARAAKLERTTDTDLQLANEIADRVRNDEGDETREGAGPIICNPRLRVEQSHTFEDPETERICKIRVDGELPDLAFDLKCWTGRFMYPGMVWKKAYNLGYHIKAAFYRDGIYHSTGETKAFVLIFVQVVSPFEIAVITCGDDYIEPGRRDYRSGISQIIACEKTGRWPGCMSGERYMKFPKYADVDNYGDDDDADDGDPVGLIIGGKQVWA